MHFSVTYTPVVAMKIGCNHGMDFLLHCRCCRVNKAVVESGLDVSWKDSLDMDNRIIFGTANTREQKLALTQLVAFVRADHDPLYLDGADVAMEKVL